MDDGKGQEAARCAAVCRGGRRCGVCVPALCVGGDEDRRGRLLPRAVVDADRDPRVLQCGEAHDVFQGSGVAGAGVSPGGPCDHDERGSGVHQHVPHQGSQRVPYPAAGDRRGGRAQA